MGNTPQITEPQKRGELAPVGHDNPFARTGGQLAEHANVGTITVESERAIAEVQAKMVVAKRFPRDEARAYDRVMAACSRPSLAAVAEYSYPRGGQTVRGPSIRLAEELARCYGNIVYGIRELSRKDGVSEMQAFAWDLESNVESTQNFTVRHVRDKKGGGQALTDERDIYEVTANMGGRRLRARLLAILPPDLVEAAVEQCRKTLAGNSEEPIADRVRKLIEAFKRFGVTSTHLSTYIGKKLDDILPEDIADLRAVYNSLKDGHAQPSDYFGAPKAVEPAAKPTANDNTPPPAARPASTGRRRRRAEDTAPQDAPEPEQSAQPEPEPEAQDDGSTAPPVAESADDEAGDDFDDMFD